MTEREAEKGKEAREEVMETVGATTSDVQFHMERCLWAEGLLGREPGAQRRGRGRRPGAEPCPLPSKGAVSLAPNAAAVP